MNHCRTLVAALALTALGQAQDGSLATYFDGGNAQDGNMFNLKATCDLTVVGFDVHFQDMFNPAPCGTSCSVTEVEVYTAPGGWNPIANSAGAWTLLGNVQHTTSWGFKVPQPLNLPVTISFDSLTPKRAVYITNTGPTNTLTGLPNELAHYTNAAGPGESYTNGDLEYVAGSGNVYPFGQVFSPRTWNGAVHFVQNAGCTGCVTDPVNYCTAGTSASGCQPTLSATGVPSSDPSNGGFIVYATGVEGQKDGIFFYGQNGRQASPWGNGTSFQCVTPPVKRSGLRQGKGTNGQCDGWAQRDLNEVWCTSGCPNAPVIPGNKLQIQFWYRDPNNTSNQTTSLTDALEVDVCP